MRKIIISLLIIISVWILISFTLNPQKYIFPSFFSVVEEFINNSKTYLENYYYTIFEILLGFIIANIIGLLLAFISLSNKLLEQFAVTMSIIIKTIPIIAIAPLLILWFGHGFGSKIAAVVISSFIPILINTLTNSKETLIKYKNIIDLYSIKKISVIRKFIIPSILNNIFAASKISISLAIVAALVSEFISANKGLGFLIVSNYYSMNIAGVFVCIILSSFFGIIMYYVFMILEKKKCKNIS